MIRLIERVELAGHPHSRLDLGERRVADALLARDVEKRAPRLQAAAQIVPIDLLHFRELREEQRVARVTVVQRLEQRDRLVDAMLVPQIDDLELVVRFALEEPPMGARAQHTRQPFGAVAAREHEEEPEHLGARRRHVRVVLVHPHAEIRIVQIVVERDGAFERLLDALAVARGGQLLVAEDAELDAGRIGGAEVEVRLRALGRAFHPGLGRGDRLVDQGVELIVERRARGIELDAPPRRNGTEDLARLARRRAAGALQLGVGLIELRVEDVVVDPDQPVDTGELSGPAPGCGDAREPQRGAGCEAHRPAGPAAHHVTLVRSCCFSACRSSASAISRSSSAG